MHMHSPSCRPGVSHPNRIATHKQCMSGCLFVCSILGDSTLHWKHNTQLGWNSWHNYMNLHLSMQQFNDFSCKLFRTLICLLHAGVLCGQCRGDKGVSALLNKCVSCHDASGLLIAGLSKFQLWDWQVWYSIQSHLHWVLAHFIFYRYAFLLL